ncbi:MAG: hypothetical protein LQ340_005231 [Diploschistes diacapsis]|nr:MAG: hypothetical protein LQ340_005231 [Diploschistes diacapsis]
MESNGPATGEHIVAGPKKPYKQLEQHSSSLPFGQRISLAQIAGPTYVTPQTLIQQVAYSLSDRLWTYSPDTFDLDVAVKDWHARGEKNVHGYMTNVEALQVRSGAASIALGYIFSKDFDLKKKHIPQSILASSSSLQYLRAALDQVSLLYAVASPFVAHVAAVDYQAGPNPGLVTDYATALSLAEEVGLALVASCSAYESQHMSLFSTALALHIPTIHIYDGVKVGRDTTRIIDVLDQGGLRNSYDAVSEAVRKVTSKHDSNDTKVTRLLEAFNNELGTDYGLFEYCGHATPDIVMVVFGTVEASLGSQIVQSLERDGKQIGLIVVRIYRPFVEEEFVKALPKSTTVVGVLGQVADRHAVSDPAVQSNLYSDVVAALTFCSEWTTPPTIVDVKYPREQAWTPVAMTSALQYITTKPLLKSQNGLSLSSLQQVDTEDTQQFTFWNLDESPLASVPTALGQALSKDSASNVMFSTKYDNLMQGGLQRTDVRKSKKSLDALFSINGADTVFVGDVSILKQVDVLGALKQGGNVFLSGPNVKVEDVEKKLPIGFRKGLQDFDAHLYILDSTAVEGIDGDKELEAYLTQVAFLRIAMPSLEKTGLQKLGAVNGNADVFKQLSDKLHAGLREIEIPEDWVKVDEEREIPPLPKDIYSNSFFPFDKSEQESPTLLKDWTTVAKSLAFREAYRAETLLRPDLTFKTWTVTLKEHRRLTPPTYDRNIMNLEFDLGDNGMEYNIGDSLGIHPRNSELEVQAFIEAYGLDPSAVVEMQTRDDPSILQSNTVYQILVDQVDIFGRPSRQFYESLASFATDPAQHKTLLALGGSEGAIEFKRRAEVDTVTFADVLEEFPSAHPPFNELVRLIPPLKRREYSIASCQKVTPGSVSLMIVTVLWSDPRGRDRFGLATRYLNALKPGDKVTVSLKPSVMKLPPNPTDPIIMAGLGTGLAPFRAFVQHRAWEKARGIEIGPVLLYMGSRHQREEYCYGEEWEAYRDAGVISLLSCAFSRDQPQKIYIQDRMRQTGRELEDAYLVRPGAFYLCGPTWPVPDVTNVLEEVIRRKGEREGAKRGKVNSRRRIEELKDAGRFVLEVY